MNQAVKYCYFVGGGKKIISGLDVLKFIMAIFIVNIHLKPFIYAPEWMRNMVSIVSALAVPIFFTISSFLFFKKIPNERFEFGKQVFHFCKRLAILYVFWCIVWSPIVYLQKDYLHDFNAFTVLLLIKDFFFASIFDASWFLGALLVGVPLVYVLTRLLKTRLFWIIPLGIYAFITLSEYYPDIWRSVNGWYINYVCGDGMNLSFPFGLVWISLGYILSRKQIINVFSQWDSTHLWLLSLIFIFTLNIYIPVFGAIITVALIFVAAYNWHLPEHPDFYKRLRTYSILFYVIHDCFKKIPKQLFGMQNGPVLFIITIAFCFLASELIIRLKNLKWFGWLKYAY